MLFILLPLIIFLPSLLRPLLGGCSIAQAKRIQVRHASGRFTNDTNKRLTLPDKAISTKQAHQPHDANQLNVLLCTVGRLLQKRFPKQRAQRLVIVVVPPPLGIRTSKNILDAPERSQRAGRWLRPSRRCR